MGQCLKYTLCISVTIFILFIIIGLPLILIFAVHSPKDPTFSVESTAVKAYNLSSDNRLFCIINLGIRVHNPNPKKYVFSFTGVNMEVRKGKHHKLADDGIRDFSLDPTRETVLPVEAVGLRVEVKRKIAEELTGDLVAGEGRVNVFMSGITGSNYLGVTCKNVVVDFSGSAVKVQSVGCKVSLSDPSIILAIS